MNALETHNIHAAPKRHGGNATASARKRRQEACKSDDSDPTPLRTALLNAIIGRHFDTASFLLENRANGDINELFSNATALYDAAYFASNGKASDQAQRLDLVRFLISRGADPAVHSMMSYEYPLHAAIALGNKLLIEELLKPAPMLDAPW